MRALSEAQVAITFDNTGNFSYKPEVYGDSITLTRTIRRTSSKYTLKGAGKSFFGGPGRPCHAILSGLVGMHDSVCFLSLCVCCDRTGGLVDVVTRAISSSSFVSLTSMVNKMQTKDKLSR